MYNDSCDARVFPRVVPFIGHVPAPSYQTNGSGHLDCVRLVSLVIRLRSSDTYKKTTQFVHGTLVIFSYLGKIGKIKVNHRRESRCNTMTVGYS